MKPHLITPVHGDIVYYETGGAEPTTSSMKLDSFNNFKISELKCKFICIDSTGQHEKGNSVPWANTITLKHRVFQQGDNWMVELKASPNADIRYTTDGSDPKIMGVSYSAPFPAPELSPFVLALARRDGVSSFQEKINVNDYRKKTVKLDPSKKAVWKRRHANLTTRDAFAFMERLKKFEGKAYGVTIDIQSNSNDQDISYTTADSFALSGANFENIVKRLQAVMSGSQIFLNIERLEFDRAQHLLDWIADSRSSLSPGEVSQ
ncbi:FN3 associated domain-containing protein [Desulfosarcina sp. BuS5]|uniref:FN3 associated domain-containing protein n=1 Tax=Desulfosarcina sp. BuS5 TaxID=933262 RepID=UPI0012F8FD0D|nr:FN3 associated domain-containing protein [Desulfosarcina sp. BuS5]